MTNEELFEDLKQFIEANVHQQLAGQLSDISSQMATKDDLDGVEQRLDDKLDQVQVAIADALTHATESLDEEIQGHEKLITRLEHQAA